MKPNNLLREYVRVMNCLDADENIKHQIISNCARYGTLNKIKAGKYKLIAVKKDQSVDRI